MTMFAGAVIVGGSRSTTVTVCVALAVFPEVSVAVYVIVVTPIEKWLRAGTPLGVTLCTLCTEGEVSVAGLLVSLVWPEPSAFIA